MISPPRVSDLGNHDNDEGVVIQDGPKPPSVKPALIVVGIAGFLILIFMAEAFLHSSRPTVEKSHGQYFHIPGTSIEAVTSNTALSQIRILDTPPADVMSNLAIPKTRKVISHQTPKTATGQYDGEITFDSSLSQSSLIAFFTQVLKDFHWKTLSISTARTTGEATAIIGEIASSDGWYWEAGATVYPTSFNGSQSENVTKFSLKLFEVPDDS